MAENTTDLLIVGAGPYGLALAAYATHLGIDHIVVGEPMAFWRDHMPEGMFLRSGNDWHLDPLAVDTIDAFMAERTTTAVDNGPLSRSTYLDYADWFRNRKGIEPLPDLILRLDRAMNGEFHATLTSGHAITSQRVVLAMGFGAFQHIPDDIVALLPPGRFSHTCDEVALPEWTGHRCLIIGGRQSAYEWAALLREAGATDVHIVHRHAPPAFAVADWSWVGPLVDAAVDKPGWYRHLSQQEKDVIGQRLHAEGRLKIEPWLEERILRDGIYLWPQSRLISCAETATGDLAIGLDNGEQLHVDHVILATGYKVEIDQLPLLSTGNLLPTLETHNGFPILDEHFETSVPGLFITSMPATQDFGPFLAFTIAVRMSAIVIGEALARTTASAPSLPTHASDQASA